MIRYDQLKKETYMVSGACERSVRFTCIYLLGSIQKPLAISDGKGGDVWSFMQHWQSHQRRHVTVRVGQRPTIGSDV